MSGEPGEPHEYCVVHDRPLDWCETLDECREVMRGWGLYRDEPLTAEDIARAFHATYEKLAPAHGYETRPESAKPWEDVPGNNRSLMVAVVERLIETGFIRPGAKVAGGASADQPN